jgi:ubiquinone/menaquinone biosynthesis C-methylase UbiE
VASASAAFPRVEFRQGSADALAFDDGSFDAVVINFGLFHFERPGRALAEAMRVLRPGGKVAFTAWAKPERALIFGIVLGAISGHGRTDVGLPQGPAFFQYSDPEGAQSVLAQAGFRNPTFEFVAQTWRMREPAELFERMRRSTVRTAALLAAQTPEALADIARAVEDGARRFQQDGEVQVPADAILATGTKP